MNHRPWTEADLAELDRLVGEGVGTNAIAAHFGRTPAAMTMKLRQVYGSARDRARTCVCGAEIAYSHGPTGGRPPTKCETCRAKPPLMCRHCGAVEVEAGRRSCDDCRGSNRVVTQRAYYDRWKNDPGYKARHLANHRLYRQRKREGVPS